MFVGQAGGTFIGKKDEVGGSENFAQTLALGNTSGANDVILEQVLTFLNNTFKLDLSVILTAGRTVSFQNASGTIALLADIPALQNLQSVLDTGNTSTQFGGLNFSKFDVKPNLTQIENSLVSGVSTSRILITPSSLTISHISASGNNFATASFGDRSVIVNILSGFAATSVTISSTKLEINDGINTTGFKYAGDYSSNFTARSLIDKAFSESLNAYTEQFSAIFNNTVNNTWQTITLPVAAVSKRVDIQITNTSGANRNGGVRAVGSGLARIGATNSDSFVMMVNSNASSQIQIFASVFADIDFRVVGTY